MYVWEKLHRPSNVIKSYSLSKWTVKSDNNIGSYRNQGVCKLMEIMTER